MVEKIEQRHRESAAAELEKRYPGEAKAQRIAAQMRAGDCDDHPSVQGAAFYDGSLKTYTFEVRGRPKFTVDAPTPAHAYTPANRHFGSLPQGAWMESGLNNFYWALGNFFD